VITAADVRAVALSLPRTEEHLIRDYTKFRVGKIVYASISPDELLMGVGFPKEQRDALIASEPDKFIMPRLSDQRFHWIVARMAALSPDEMRELITDSWRMVVPKKVVAAHLGGSA
jgi:hypothetical protein